MRRVAALRLLGGFAAASLSGCAGADCGITLVPLAGTRASITRFGTQIYPSDDVERALTLIAACGGALVRIGINGQFDFADAVFAGAAQRSMRVVLLTDFAAQPVDAAAFSSRHVEVQKRYAKYDPIWEIWNEPNLERYWGAPPDIGAYTRLAIATGNALRDAGANDVWSGGTSGIDFDWIVKMKAAGVFDVLNGCAVHSYDDPCTAAGYYRMLTTIVPDGVGIHTTETCVPQAPAQSEFLRSMWDIHRNVGLGSMIWCELRDGTAGNHGSYALPYGLVTKTYVPKPVYRTAQALVG